MTRRRLRWTFRILVLGVVAPALIFVGVRWGTGNFGTVLPGLAYRSAQPTGDALRTTIRARGIKTVLNLRGANPGEAWYDAERRATLDSGATQIDFPMSSDQWISREQARTLLDVLDSCDYPVMIHCEWGSERTGLVSALRALLREGSTLADGRREFSAYYMFLPMKDGLVMRGHLDRYERWLAERGEPHSPDRLRDWLLRDYRPGSPSREHWDCNPYPLKVVSRPGRAEVASWGSNPCPVLR